MLPSPLEATVVPEAEAYASSSSSAAAASDDESSSDGPGPDAEDADADADAKTYEIRTIEGLDAYFSDPDRLFRRKNRPDKIDYDKLLTSLSVVGDTQCIGDPDRPDSVHPVLKLLHERKRTRSPLTPVDEVRPDGKKVALVVEGGGMRGCVSAGMVAAIHHLGLQDAFDVVYGSSAGTVIGSYFITRQLPWFGPEIYYDALTTAGRDFIDTRRLLRAVGLGLLDPRLVKDVMVRRRDGKPVLNLSYLLVKALQERKPLDWDKFVEMQKVQPLKLVASGLRSQRAAIMDMAGGNFTTINELAECMHASCLLPGIAGPVINHDKRSSLQTGSTETKKFQFGNGLEGEHWEPLADALIFQPLPYKAALDDGATHCVVLRTRPDGVDVTGKGSSVFERMILRRFFCRKNDLPQVHRYMREQRHKKLYGRDVLYMNDQAADFEGGIVMPVALPPGSEEVTRLETGREAIFEGVRRGFARAYDALVEDPNERGRGAEVAREYFPDEILEYEPEEWEDRTESAYARDRKSVV